MRLDSDDVVVHAWLFSDSLVLAGPPSISPSSSNATAGNASSGCYYVYKRIPFTVLANESSGNNNAINSNGERAGVSKSHSTRTLASRCVYARDAIAMPRAEDASKPFSEVKGEL